MEVLQNVSDIFWSKSFWLPENVTWEAMIEKREKDGMNIALARDLWASIPIAFLLFAVRLFWERFIASPIGRYFGIRETLPKKAERIPELEAGYKKYGKAASGETLMGLAKQIDRPQRFVERWWRRRRSEGKPSEMQRFRETSWRFVFYVGIFYFGLYALWDKPYFWDTKHCWYGYPYQSVPSEIYYYYMIELGFYFSLCLSLFMDIRRKDFLEMMIHHFATIALMLFSWANNMVRIGTLVIIVHDAVDYWMEGAKLAKYCKFHKLCDVLFVIFALMWFITRIVLYPLRILKAALLDATAHVGYFTGHSYMSCLLVALQILHIVWFYTILKMVYAYVIAGQVEKDDRSDTEMSESDSNDEGNEETTGETVGKPNGKSATNGLKTRQARS